MSVRNTVKSIQDIMRQDSGVDGDAQRISQLCWMFFLKIIDDQDQQLELMQDEYRSPIPKELRWRAWAADPEGITGEDLLTFVNTQLFPKLKELSVTGKQGDRRRVVRRSFSANPPAKHGGRRDRRTTRYRYPTEHQRNPAVTVPSRFRSNRRIAVAPSICASCALTTFARVTKTPIYLPVSKEKMTSTTLSTPH
jgi:HsdM N-terminal domain